MPDWKAFENESYYMIIRMTSLHPLSFKICRDINVLGQALAKTYLFELDIDHPIVSGLDTKHPHKACKAGAKLEVLDKAIVMGRFLQRFIWHVNMAHYAHPAILHEAN
eukprot:jgi/Psemu1/3452/gm1.3452_g